MKKTLSFVLALVMIMAVAIPAFASDPVSSGTVDLSSSVNVPTIDVALPTATAIILNPYGLTTMGEDAIDAAQIQQDAMFLENKSEVAVKVNLAVTGALPTTNTDRVAFATASTIPAAGKAPATTKSIFMYVDVQEVADKTAVDIAGYTNSASQIAVKAGEVKKDVAVLDASGGAKAFAQICVGGDMVAAPAVAWTANDAVTVKMVFDCTATVRATPAA